MKIADRLSARTAAGRLLQFETREGGEYCVTLRNSNGQVAWRRPFAKKNDGVLHFAELVLSMKLHEGGD